MQLRLLLDAGAHLDPESLVVDKSRKVAAIHATPVVPCTAFLPRPIARRVPVRDVMMLIFVADESRRSGDHALALPIERPILQTFQWQISPLFRAPSAKTSTRLRRVPVPMFDIPLAMRIAA